MNGVQCKQATYIAALLFYTLIYTSLLILNYVPATLSDRKWRQVQSRSGIKASVDSSEGVFDVA